MKTENIALFGLGKLGLPLALILSKYYKTFGIDVDNKKVADLKVGVSPFFEPKLDDYLKENISNINFQTANEYDINEFDVAIILVNTPSNENGEFSNHFIFDVIRNLSIKLKKTNKKDFLFILSSTVMPKSHELIISEIEKISEKKLNDGFGFVYIPDLVALGNVIDDFQNPDLVILGQSSEKYGEIAKNIYSKFIKNNAPFIKMNLIESEITKVSLNAFITMKISFANFIGNICEKLNCNSDNITKALGYDKRISPHYIKSGLAFGGTCFPRDTWAFIKMSEILGLDALHIKATQKINEQQNLNLYEKVSKFKDKKIGIYGLSFKFGTSVTTESPGNILYQKLLSEKFDVVFFDELIDNEYKFLGFDKFLEDSEVIIFTHNLKLNLDEKKLKNKTIINPWKN